MTAESLTAALENTPLGETWAEPFANAESVNDASFAAAAAALFPAELAPTTADALAQYGMLIERISSAQYGDIVGEPHVFGNAFFRSAMLFPGLRSSMSQTASAKIRPSS